MKKVLFVLLVMAMFTACTDDFKEIEDTRNSELFEQRTEGDGDPEPDPNPGG